jgi:hypothetical protein
MAEIKSEFTVDFNVLSDSLKYEQFIKSIRSRLGVSFCGQTYLDPPLPVLPPQEYSRTKWFHIVLRNDTSQCDSQEISHPSQEITLRIQWENLHLDGYKMGHSGPWLKFGVLPGSEFIGFYNYYTDLGEAAGFHLWRYVDRDEYGYEYEYEYEDEDEGKGKRKKRLIDRDDIFLGKNELIDPVNSLSISTDCKIRARSLIIVMHMIILSIKFRIISTFLTANYNKSMASQHWIWMIFLDRGWEHLSIELLDTDDTDDSYQHRFNPLPLPTWHSIERSIGIYKLEIRKNYPQVAAIFEYGISTAEEALNILGILAGRFRPKYKPRGLSMVEVFKVRINVIEYEREGPLNLYGTIDLAYEPGFIYKRERNNCEIVEEFECVFLTGPFQSISAEDSFTINLDLKDKVKEMDEAMDREICKGQLLWNMFDRRNVFDRVLSKLIGGEDGSVIIEYAVLSDAVEAFLEFTLYEGGLVMNDGLGSDLLGSITAYNGVGESLLFQKKRDTKMPGTIGLRSVVAVKLNSTLEISAHLWNSSNSKEIVNGTACFPAVLAGTSKEESIHGMHGEIKLKVTWNKDLWTVCSK